jgi:hypothetical protein
VGLEVEGRLFACLEKEWYVFHLNERHDSLGFESDGVGYGEVDESRQMLANLFNTTRIGKGIILAKRDSIFQTLEKIPLR